MKQKLEMSRLFFRIKRVFFELTILDFLILVVVGVLGAFFIYYFNRDKSEVFVDIISPSFEWSEDFLPHKRWQTDSIETGDVVFNSLGRKVAEVVKVTKTPWSGGRREFVYLTIRIDAILNERTGVYVFDGVPLLIGRKIKLDTQTVTFDGEIVDVYQNYDDRLSKVKKTKAEVEVKYPESDPWVAEKIKDLEIVNSEGQVILKAVKTDIALSEVAEANYLGQLVKTQNPLKRDVVVKFELPNVVCSSVNCFYNTYMPLTIGGEFWIDSGDLILGQQSSIVDIKYFSDE